MVLGATVSLQWHHLLSNSLLQYRGGGAVSQKQPLPFKTLTGYLLPLASPLAHFTAGAVWGRETSWWVSWEGVLVCGYHLWGKAIHRMQYHCLAATFLEEWAGRQDTHTHQLCKTRWAYSPHAPLLHRAVRCVPATQCGATGDSLFSTTDTVLLSYTTIWRRVDTSAP